MFTHRAASKSVVWICGLAAACSISAARGQGCLTWVDKSQPPGDRLGHAMAFDSARGATVLFGGTQGLLNLRGDTWERQGTNWVPRSTTGPSPRSYAAMAYDSGRGVTVLFGGNGAENGNGAQPLGDTWEWNGTVWTLRHELGPPPTFSHSLAYDSARGVTVLFGGEASNETWEWDGAAWTLRSTNGPSAHRWQAMAYDIGRGVVVLFGGLNGGTYSGDTWEWDGHAWSLRATDGPSPRGLHTMAYDASRGTTVLFGGYYHDGVPYTSGMTYGDTWEWNGSAWSLVSESGPAPRTRSQAVYDSARGTIAMFGGTTIGNTAENITWEWDGATWTDVTTGTSPSARFGTSMVYDGYRDRAILFGGHGHNTPLRDTWEWDGIAWALRATGGPPAVLWHTMAYDSGRHVAVLFGGQGDPQASPGAPIGTWEWDGNTWALRSTDGPPHNIWQAMAYDAARGVTVLYGAYYDDTTDTWEWDGNTWTKVSTVGPPPRWKHAMAYDSRRGVTVLFGGRYDGVEPPVHLYFGDTWEWDGVSWSLRSETGPPPREHSALAYDDTRGVTLLLGGSGPEADARTWEWDGISWTPRSASGPGWREEQGMAYDSARGVAIMFGGYAGVIRGDTWERSCDPECTEAAAREVYVSPSGPVYPTKNRYLSFAPPALPSGANGVALRVTLESMPGESDCPGVPDFSAFNGASMWVGPEVMQGATPTGVFALRSEPYFRDWSTVPGGVVQLSDCNVVPCAKYRVDAISDVTCGDAGPSNFSPPLFLSTTAKWGDIVGATRSDLPNGIVNFVDVSSSVDRFRAAAGAPPGTWCDLVPNNPTQGVNLSINFQDISAIVDAFKGREYPFPGPTAPAACP